ncbi:MAG: hypothetical protein ACLVKR_03000 [Lachnospiraceae bacterium]
MDKSVEAGKILRSSSTMAATISRVRSSSTYTRAIELKREEVRCLCAFV